MFINLLSFEWLFFARRKSVYISFIVFLLLGVLLATRANLSFPNTSRNAPFVISYLLGLTSLLAVFAVTILSAQTLFREKDAQFENILYATALSKFQYLSSRFLCIFLLTAFNFLLLITGMLVGHSFLIANDQLLPISLKSYLVPFLYIVLPNLFFFTSIICAIGWFFKNKLTVYLAGLLIYFLYMGVSIFANAPMMATSAKLTGSGMSLAAKIDPFGLSAFFEQTRLWTSAERNTQLVSLSGNLLLNRICLLVLALLLTIISFFRYKFRVSREKNKQKLEIDTVSRAFLPLRHAITRTDNLYYQISSFYSYFKIDLKTIFKGMPFKLIALAVLAMVSIEIYSEMSGSVRFPERFATSSLMVNRIISTYPLFALLIVLFYGAEIFYNSKSARFDSLEMATPVSRQSIFLARWAALSIVPCLLLLMVMIVGVVFQLATNDAVIDWMLYYKLFYFIGLPLSLSAGFVLVVHHIINNKYLALCISAALLIFTQTSFSSMLGINHPMLSIAKPLQVFHSDMNGFGTYTRPFHWQMLYWSGILLLSLLLIHLPVKRATFTVSSLIKSKRTLIAFSILSLVIICSGLVLFSSVAGETKKEKLKWQEGYERKYRSWNAKPQPIITSVKTFIELFPESNSYAVQGLYRMQNKSATAIDTLLVYATRELYWSSMLLEGAELISTDAPYNHYFFKLKKPLEPGAAINMRFSFQYKWNGFSKHDPFNSIIGNGSFLRISNYFPVFGYQNSNEISDVKQRRLRNLEAGTKVPSLTAPRLDSSAHDFISLEMKISTSANQTAIGIGELKRKWTEGNRNYFEYIPDSPVPFRFAVASAKFAESTIQYEGIRLTAYYHPAHHQNIKHMLETAKNSLEYFGKSFGSYPFKTLRLVEISSFTTGFAGTAYPTSFFITENFGYTNKVQLNSRKDILNELTSHELSHTWWGNSMLAPDYRQGSRLLTETLAMYSELMVYKKTYGEEQLRERVDIHKQIYLSDRVFAEESPLIKADPRHVFLCYDKGMYAMYRVYKLLGEEKTNIALRNLLQKYSYPKAPPISTDLISELYNLSDSTQRALLHELFEEVVTHNIRVDSAKWSASGKLQIAATLIKYTEDGKGHKTAVDLNELMRIKITYPNGKAEYVDLWPVRGKISVNLSLGRKPEKILIDPDGLFMDISEEDNEAIIE